MGLDVNSIRARLAQLSNKTKKAKDIWKPTDEHDVRAVPHKFSKGDDPFCELFFHYEIGNEPAILCPKKNFGDDCDVCDFCDVLRAWKDQDGNDKPENDRKMDWEMCKKIDAKSSFFYPLVERGKENEGALWCRVNPTNYNALLTICADEDNNKEVLEGRGSAGTGVLFDTRCAYDLHVSFKKKGEKGNNKTFNVVEFKEKKKTSPLHKDQAVVEKILASVKPIYDVYQKVSSAEVSKIFKKFVGSARPEAKAEGGEEYAANTTETAAHKGGKTVEEAFNDLLAD